MDPRIMATPVAPYTVHNERTPQRVKLETSDRRISRARGSFNPLHHVEKCLPLSTKPVIDTVFRNFAGAAAPDFCARGYQHGSLL